MNRVIAALMILVSCAPAVDRTATPTRQVQPTPTGHQIDGDRLALVIGNGQYEQSPLKNPVNDARAIARALMKVGFDVTILENADQNSIKRAVSRFGKSLERAGKDGVGLFYYAGHGVQVGGQNYLIPVNAPISSEADVDIFGVSVQSVLGQMEYAGNDLNIVVLDSCRDNPFRRSFRSTTRGLAQMSAPSGSLVAFATAPGDVALDGEGSNSPYSSALAKQILVEGQELGTVFKRVAATIKSQTNGDQVPWTQSSVTGDFYFTGKIAIEGTLSNRPPPSGSGTESVFWQSVESSNRIQGYESYIDQYPNGVFTSLARSRVQQLQEERMMRQLAEYSCDDPLPGNLDFEEPAPTVPAEYAQFSGIWYGRWGGQLCSRLVVSSIDEDGNVDFIYSWGEKISGSYTFKSGYHRGNGKISNGILTLDTGNQIEFQMKGEKSIAGTHTRKGRESYVTMGRLF